MTTTKSETLTLENKGHKTKCHPEDKEEVNPSKKKEHHHHHHHHHHHPVSELPRSIRSNASKAPSAPYSLTLQDSLDHSMSDGDPQMVVASHSHSFVSDGAIKVVEEELNKTMATTKVAVMDVEDDVEEEGTRDGVSKKEGTWYIVLLGLRIAAFVLCNVAFSVLAADQKKKVRTTFTSWYDYYVESSSQDQVHWYDFREFKYCLSVNVIGFVYSGLQICDLLKYLYTKRHTVDPKLRGYFNFAMDQVMAYLLMSASSSAATIAYYWAKSTDTNKYVEMANASVALSFVAFVAFACSSIVSAFIFCRFN